VSYNLILMDKVGEAESPHWTPVKSQRWGVVV